jgi:hypothetical protein
MPRTITTILHSQHQSIPRCVNAFTYAARLHQHNPGVFLPPTRPATWSHFSWSSTSRSAEIRKVLAGRLFKNDSERERFTYAARLPDHHSGLPTNERVRMEAKMNLRKENQSSKSYDPRTIAFVIFCTIETPNLPGRSAPSLRQVELNRSRCRCAART